MRPQLTEQARFVRPAGLVGVEALHATFVSHRYAPHLHDEWTIAQVIAGAARFQLEGRWHTAPAGTAFVIPPGAVHTGEPATTDGYKYRVLYLEPSRLRDGSEGDLTSAPHGLPVVLRVRTLARALTLLHATLPVAGMVLEQSEALARVSHELVDLVGSAERSGRRGAHPAVAAARAYILEHWRQNFSLEELARVAGLSPFHLVRSFREELGAPPSAYRRALRVQAAQKMLRAGTPPARTAAECGFYDQAHLNRHFKRVTGVTPARYLTA